MESHQHHYDTSWSSSTNWSIAGGSLLNSITFESSAAPVTGSSQHEDDVDDLNAADSAPKFPLILCPASPDSSPCEITLDFAQKHGVRQVYVRSTARVYEIYYASKPQRSNEYLCTVRCGVASRDEGVLHAPNLDEATLVHLKGSNKDLGEKITKSDSTSSSNEDDWVEVKPLDTPVLDRGSSMPSNSIVNSFSTQELYEATAEITDANPCTSITLRLLSLWNKGCVCVDELYVFADPVESATSEDEASQTGNASGSSLMAMLAPTLLQLSKSADLRHLQREDIFGMKKKGKTQENESKAMEPLNFRCKIPQEGKPSLANWQEAVSAHIEPNRHEIPPLKDREAKADISCGHIATVVDQLLSQVSRVEDLLLKFEEKMLKPISSIDSRLQRVEEQLEELTKKPKNSDLPSCTRYSAPEFSCNDSDNYTPYDAGTESSCHELCASHEKDLSSSTQPDETISQSLPSLVVTAPEFSNADDEEVDHASRTDSPKNKPEQTMSIDDVLASALASFISSTSIEPQNYTQALAVKAPDFLHEDGSVDKKVSPNSHFEAASEPCSIDTRIGMDSATAVVSAYCPLESVNEVTCSLNDNDSEVTYKEVEDCQEQATYDGTDDCMGGPACHDLHQMSGDVGNVEVGNGSRKILVLDEADILNQFLENHVDGVSAADGEGAPGNLAKKAEVTKQDLHKELLQNVLEISCDSSKVDFETPILDVKFTCQDNSNNKSPLEVLLSDLPVTYTGSSCSKKSDDGSQAGEDSEEGSLITVGNEEPALMATSGHFSVDLDGYTSSSMPSNLDYHSRSSSSSSSSSNQERWATSLI